MAPFPPAVGGIATWAQGLLEYSQMNTVVKYIPLDEADNNAISRGYFSSVLRCVKIWKKLKNELSVGRVDVVHINIPANTLSMLREVVSIFIVHKYHKKVIVHFHCTVPTTIRPGLGYRLFRTICKKTDGIITLNRKSYRFVRKYNDNTVVIPNYANLEMLSHGKKREISESINTVLFVGNIIEEKGCLDIIEVAKQLPEIQFRLVGGLGIDLGDCKLPANVVLAGIKKDKELEQEFLSADLFLFLTYMPTEGFSVALTEAMAYGLPCVATDWAANKDMLEGNGGVIVPIRSVTEVTEAIRKLNNCKDRKEMSAWNVSKVEKRYTLPKVFEKISKFYSSI